MNPEQHAPDFHKTDSILERIQKLTARYESTKQPKEDIKLILEQCPNSVLSRLLLSDQQATETIIVEYNSIVQDLLQLLHTQNELISQTLTALEVKPYEVGYRRVGLIGSVLATNIGVAASFSTPPADENYG